MVSVIIPNYNHAPYLKQRIQTVINQTYRNFEVIILDDNSSDNSREIINEYKQHEKVKHLVYNEINSGSPFIQWKKGIDLAKGEYIWIAESDDYSDLTFLEKTVGFIERDKNAVICYTASITIENGKAPEINKTSLYYNRLFNTERWLDNFENDGKEELINYIGGFCTIINASSCVFLKSAYPIENKDIYKFKYCGDWLVWIEMCLRGKVLYIKDPLNYFRIHASSTINKFSQIKKSEEFYLCLLKARVLTNGQSVIPNETLNIAFYMWTYNSLYFFLKNFRFSFISMHNRLDKNLSGKIISLLKNYYKIKFNKT